MWLDKICRLCGQISDNVSSIFDNDNKKMHFELKLRKCLSIPVSIRTKFSIHIVRICR